MSGQAMQFLMLVGVPYAAIAVFAAGLVWRHRARFTVSALSSQIIEGRWLAWGALPFHAGIGILFLGHLLPLVAPGPWQRMLASRGVLLAVESIGVAAALLCILGLAVLFLRRTLVRPLRPLSTVADLLVLSLLLAQVLLGLQVALTHRWGAVWSTVTTTPYLWSLITLRHDPALVAGLPPVMLLHMLGAWVLLAVLPFTRLVHMFALPLGYPVRPPQKVVWATNRPTAQPVQRNQTVPPAPPVSHAATRSQPSA